jgi:hypothetical protein
MPEPEEIEAAEEPTQSLVLPEAESDAVQTRELSPAQQEQVEAAEETLEVPVVDETAAEETQQLPSPEEVASESAVAETQVLPPAEESAPERTAGTNQLPPAEEVRREAAAFEDTQEFLPGQEATVEDPIPKEARQETRRDLPSAEQVVREAEERTRRRKGGRLRRFAEPPPVDAVDDPDIIPGFRDDD